MGPRKHESVAFDCRLGWKGDRPWVRLKERTGEPTRSPKIISVFPRHPPFEGMLKPAFISQRQDEEPPNIWDTSSISGNVFAHPQASSSAPHPQELNSSKRNTRRKTTKEPNHMSIAEKSGKTKARLRSEMPVRTVSQKIQSSSVEETLQRIMGQTNNDCRFRIFILTNSLRQLRLRAGR